MLLALTVISGGSLAAGDLFDDDYTDCPVKTRLRDGEISDLVVARDADDEDHVNVSWAATDPDTWGLGANAYNTSLVIILDDGGSTAQTLSLGTRQTTFDDIMTGTEVTVQLAIVVDTAEGEYLISDILEASINQSLTEPAFMTTDWMRVTQLANPAKTPPVELKTEKVAGGTFYYVGYNENFGNYKSESMVTRPSTPRLRIGLAHGGEDADKRDDVDFEAYIMRITDEDGDVVPEGDDVASVASAYGDRQLVAGTSKTTLAENEVAFRNVRINDDGMISVAMQNAPPPFTAEVVDPSNQGLSFIKVADLAADNVYAAPPDEHRDFPIDVLASDETYTFEAWAVNEEDEIISPVAKLTVRPIDTDIGAYRITDYMDPEKINEVMTVTVTEFTVLK